MDIKTKIAEITGKIQGDPKLLANFQSDPEKTVESLLGVDIPDDVAKNVITGVKGALTADKLSGAADALKSGNLSGAAGALKKLF